MSVHSISTHPDLVYLTTITPRVSTRMEWNSNSDYETTQKNKELYLNFVDNFIFWIGLYFFFLYWNYKRCDLFKLFRRVSLHIIDIIYEPCIEDNIGFWDKRTIILCFLNLKNPMLPNRKRKSISVPNSVFLKRTVCLFRQVKNQCERWGST